MNDPEAVAWLEEDYEASVRSQLILTSAEVEVLTLIAAYKDIFQAPIDSLSLEWYLRKGIESGCDGPWINELVKGGSAQNIARSIAHMQSNDLIEVSADRYAITRRGFRELEECERHRAWRTQSFWAADLLRQEFEKEKL